MATHCHALGFGFLAGVACIAAIARADAPPTCPASPSDEAPRLMLPTPATQPSTRPVDLAPSAATPLMPRLTIHPPATRPIASPAKLTESASNHLRPLQVSMSTLEAAGPVRIEPGVRHVPTPAPPVVVRIPNLITVRRKAIMETNPLGSPATAVRSPTVNNLEGTTALSVLSPARRMPPIDVCLPPSVMPFDQDPYVQVPGAPDDQDTPVGEWSVPAPPRLP